MQVTYYESPEVTLLTCSEQCTAAAMENYAYRGYIVYLGHDGLPLTEDDANTRRLIAANEIPHAENCDFCRQELN
jgi:hypothetical protein